MTRQSALTLEPAAPDSIADVAAHLAAWATRAPSGLASVAYDSEHSRRAVEAFLERDLEEAGVAFSRIELPLRRPASEVVDVILERLGELSSGVASLRGFGTAFPDKDPLPDSLYAINLNRERLAGFPVRQIWWMPRPFADAFARVAPDTHSWFIVRLSLTEVGPPRSGDSPQIDSTERPHAPLEEARARANFLKERFYAAVKAREAPGTLLDLAAQSIDALRDAGAIREGQALGDEIAPKLARALPRHAGSRSLDRIALAIGDMKSNSNRRSTAASLNSLANLYANQGNYGAALPLYERALAIKEKALEPEHPDTAQSLNNLANLYANQGNYAAALPLYQRALAIREMALGPEHPDTAASLNNLALLHSNQGNHAAALPLYERALTITEKALGPEHPSTAQTLNNLATLYANQGNYAAALPLYQRAVAIREKALGPEHPDTAASLNNLALLHSNQGNHAAALPLYERALTITEKALGPEHPHTAASLNNLAGVYDSQGNYAAALPLVQRALAIHEKALGPEHPDTATSLNNLANLYADQGDYAAALPLYERALAIRGKALGPEHPNTKLVRKNLYICREKA